MLIQDGLYFLICIMLTGNKFNFFLIPNPVIHVVPNLQLCFVEPILVITEYCSRGNLRKILRKSRIERFYENSSESYINIVSTLSHRILLKLAADVANGMKHLASHQVKLMIRIFKNISVLVNSVGKG